MYSTEQEEGDLMKLTKIDLKSTWAIIPDKILTTNEVTIHGTSVKLWTYDYSGRSYLCKIDGQFYAGKFTREPWGLIFGGWHGTFLRLDPKSKLHKWEGIWEIEE